MNSIHELSAEQLRGAAVIKEQIERLQSELESLFGGGGNGVPSPFSAERQKRRRMGIRPTGPCEFRTNKSEIRYYVGIGSCGMRLWHKNCCIASMLVGRGGHAFLALPSPNQPSR
jgi:hypothetical protein